jgi:hypothetical protein
MPNRSPILNEDNSGLATPLEPGSVVPGPTPGYYQIAAPGVVLALDDLSDVTITTPVNGNFFQYDGTKWVNNTVLTSGRIPYTTTNGRLADNAVLAYDAGTGNITHGASISTLKLGVGTAVGVAANTKLVVGSSAGVFGASTAAAHFIDNTNSATINVQNTSAVGYAAFDLFNSSNTKTATIAWSNSGGSFANTLWISTRTANDLWFGTNTTERMRITSTGAVQVATSLAIGGGTAITKVVVYTPTLAPASVAAAGDYVEQTFTVTGLATTDTITVNQPAMTAPHCQMVAFRVSAANTLALTFHSVSGSHLPPQGVYRVVAIRS